jgi:integrase
MASVTGLRAGTEGVPPAAAVDAYLATITVDSTKRAYKFVLDRFAGRFAGADDVAAIGPGEIGEWFTAMWGNCSPRRWNSCRAALQSAYRWWEEQQWVPDRTAPLAQLKRHKLPPEGPRGLTRDEIETLLTRKDVALREKVLWSLLYESAARSAEVLRLDVQDLDMGNHCAQVTRKGGKADVIGWQSRTAMLLPRLLKGRKTGPVFLTERRSRSDVRRALGDIDPATGKGRLTYDQAETLFKTATGGLSLHVLRHSRLTHEAERGTGTPMLKALSGHESERSLHRYAKVSKEALLRHLAETDPARRR